MHARFFVLIIYIYIYIYIYMCVCVCVCVCVCDIACEEMESESIIHQNVPRRKYIIRSLLTSAFVLFWKNLFTAGTDTSSSIIEWSLAEMLKNPRILKQAQDEMDQVIGRNRRLEESDIPKLPYLQAICKETFRKHPSTPLNLPRIADQACEVNGYYIPKGTRLSVNIWAIGRDPDVWDNPLDFTPERFFSEKYAKINPRGNDFELIPFGAGRRICAGTRMGIVLVQYILGTLVHSFDWKLPKDVELNMDEVFGLALQKAVPLSAMVTPRLEPNAYLA